MTAPLERALLGAMLASPDVRDLVDLEPTDFSAPARAAAYRAILELREEGGPLDAFLVAYRLETTARGLVPRGGWAAALFTLVDESGSYWCAGAGGNPYDGPQAIGILVSRIRSAAARRALKTPEKAPQ